MPKYKITHVYVLEAESRKDALERIGADALAYLEWQSISELVEKANGWIGTVKDQFTGK